MFHADITFVLALIALATGGFLVLFAKIHKDISTGICSVVGYAVAILAILAILCSSYGMFRSHVVRHQMMANRMQRTRMAPCRMMRRHRMTRRRMVRHMQRRYRQQMMLKQMQMQKQIPVQGVTKPVVQIQKKPMMQSTQPKTVTTSS